MAGQEASGSSRASGQRRRRKAPSILQFEAVECGAASLAMILAHFGAWVPLERLRTACGVSRDGSKASNILKAARSFGLNAKGFRKETESLRDLPWPLIVHWNFNHFVVFEGFSKGRAWINDPASGPRSVSMEEFDAAFTGVALAFEPTPQLQRTRRPPGIISSLRRRLAGSKAAFAFIGLISVLLVIPGLLIPVFAMVFVDGVLINQQERWLIPLVAGIVLTALLRMLLLLLQQRILIRLETKLAVAGAATFIWHVLRLPMSFFMQRHPGEVANRVSSNEEIATLLSGEFSNTVVSMTQVVFFGLVMLAYDFVLGVVVIALAVPNYLLLRFMRERMNETSGRVLNTQGKLAAATVGAIQNIETLKASGMERQAFERWAGHHANSLDALREQGTQAALLAVVPALLTGLTGAAVLGLGAWRVMGGALTIGDLVAFQSLSQSFAAPLAGFVALGSTASSLRVSLQRVDDALKNPRDPLVDGAGVVAPVQMRGEVELCDVTFGYSKLEPPLLTGVSLRLKPGMRVAFVGGSGSGKSTLGRLICGLLEPWSGDIRFDGRPIASIPQTERARSVAYVDQDIFLFEGTVRDNLTLWNRGAPEESLTNALSDAAMFDDVSQRAGRLDAHVEEGGRNFSGGQRQRLEIARALAGEPSVLILDEATAALDAATEKAIDDALRRRGCTCIIIAHRLSTIRDCDEIIVLQRGRVVERGAHEALMALDGEYASLIRSA